MAFVRSFDVAKLNDLTNDKAELFARLKLDVRNGEVFPAVRKDELHFYYKGGCLYRLKGGSFVRNPAYNKAEYSLGTDGLDAYETAKMQCKNRYFEKESGAMERQLLDGLNRHTFLKGSSSKVVVLDIEVNLNGTKSGQKKCDLVLLNKDTRQIMFVEGKLFKDKRVLVMEGFIPAVIEQVDSYSMGLKEQSHAILEQYLEHIRIVKQLFDCDLLKDSAFEGGTLEGGAFEGGAFEGGAFEGLELVQPAKLLVYNTPHELTANGRYSKKTITDALLEQNVMWVGADCEASLEDIWEALCK